VNQWLNNFTQNDVNLSFSRLRHAIEHDWAHFRYNQLNKPTVGPAANFSRLFHQVLLEPASTLNLVHEPQFNLRTGDGRADFDYWATTLQDDAIVVAQHHSAAWMIEKLNRPNITVINSEDLIRATRMAEAVKARPFWATIAPDAEYEKAGEFEHAGVTIRFKADIVCSARALLADIKAMPEVSPDAVSRKALEYFIDAQAALYMRGASLIDGIEYRNFVIVAVENVEPYCVQEYTIPPHVIQSAWDLVRSKIEEYQTCLLNDYWPERSKQPLPLPWPNWMLNKREAMSHVDE